MTDRKKPEPDVQPPAQPPAKIPFRPRKIKPTDISKYHIISDRGKTDFVHPFDENEARRNRQLKSSRIGGILNQYWDKLEKRIRKEDVPPRDIKAAIDSYKAWAESDERAWAGDIAPKPRTGSVEDLDELMESAVTAFSRAKDKHENKSAIDVKATEVPEKA